MSAADKKDWEEIQDILRAGESENKTLLLWQRRDGFRKRRGEVVKQIKALSKVDDNDVLAMIERVQKPMAEARMGCDRELADTLGVRDDILSFVALTRGLDVPCDAHYRQHLEWIEREFGPPLRVVC